MKKDLGERYRVLTTPKEGAALGAGALVMYLIMGPEEGSMFADNVAAVANAAHEAHQVGLPLIVEATLWGSRIEDKKDPERLAHICRIAAEIGADAVKTEYTGDPATMAEVVEGCPVPLLTLGGARGGEGAVVEAARGAIEGGAKGLIFGRNVWQADDPVRMTASLREVVHGVATLRSDAAGNERGTAASTLYMSFAAVVNECTVQVKASPIASAVEPPMPGGTWEQVSRVMAMVECPRNSWTNLAWTPLDSRIVAQVWRRSWKRTRERPARSSNGLNERCARLWRLSGVPISVANTRPFSCHESPARSISLSCRVKWQVKASRVVWESFTVRRLLAVFVPLTRSTPASKSTSSHPSANSSPCLIPVCTAST